MKLAKVKAIKDGFMCNGDRAGLRFCTKDNTYVVTRHTGDTFYINDDRDFEHGFPEENEWFKLIYEGKTNYEKITESKESLMNFLNNIAWSKAAWLEEFFKAKCEQCPIDKEPCNIGNGCPYEGDLEWWLDQEAQDEMA